MISGSQNYCVIIGLEKNMKARRFEGSRVRRGKGHSRQIKDFWGLKFPLLFLRRGGQTTKSSNVRNINGLAGVVDIILRNKSNSAESVLTTPAGKAELYPS